MELQETSDDLHALRESRKLRLALRALTLALGCSALACHDPIDKIATIWSASALVVGDCTGDGIDDVLAYRFAARGQSPKRTACLLSGADGTEAWRMSDVLQDVALPSVAACGDLDGDGRAELAVRTWGGWSLVSGTDGAELHRLEENSIDSVCGSIDLDGDGRSDFVSGAPSIRVAPGPSGVTRHGRLLASSGLDGHELWKLEGGDGERLGGLVALASIDGEPVIATTRVARDRTGVVLLALDGTLQRTLDFPPEVKRIRFSTTIRSTNGRSILGIAFLDDYGRVFVLSGKGTLDLKGIAAGIDTLCGIVQHGFNGQSSTPQLAVTGSAGTVVLDAATGLKTRFQESGAAGTVFDRRKGSCVGSVSFDGDAVRMSGPEGELWSWR